MFRPIKCVCLKNRLNGIFFLTVCLLCVRYKVVLFCMRIDVHAAGIVWMFGVEKSILPTRGQQYLETGKAVRYESTVGVRDGRKAFFVKSGILIATVKLGLNFLC